MPAGCQRQLHKSIEQTSGNNGLTLILALSYGGWIVDGVKSLLREVELGRSGAVEMFSKHLYTRYYPDPDLLIRTSGEMRISNFLLWQLSYTEMSLTPKMWPSEGRSLRRGAGIRPTAAPLRTLQLAQQLGIFLLGDGGAAGEHGGGRIELQHFREELLALLRAQALHGAFHPGHESRPDAELIHPQA